MVPLCFGISKDGEHTNRNIFSMTLSGPSRFQAKKVFFFFMDFYSEESFYAREISFEFFLFFFLSQMTIFFFYNYEMCQKSS